MKKEFGMHDTTGSVEECRKLIQYLSTDSTDSTKLNPPTEY
jgi:hypothetical protein